MQIQRMEVNFDKLLSLWMGLFFYKVDKLNFKDYGLNALFSLKGVQLDEPILRAVTRFKDLEFHVFRFSPTLKELCPIEEEFEALFIILRKGEVICLIMLNGYVNSMVSFLRVQKDAFFLIC